MLAVSGTGVGNVVVGVGGRLGAADSAGGGTVGVGGVVVGFGNGIADVVHDIVVAVVVGLLPLPLLPVPAAAPAWP